jgi:peptidoglycan/xylan/chitin deacetylase (PgdA/CDA1 family)
LSCTLLLLAGVVAACSGGGGTDPPPERSCSGAAALTAAPYAGGSLGAKQIALTFDDGPASRTEELSAYLASQGIHAGFFVNGKNVAAYPNALAKLVADGHVIGNHTQDHADLTDKVAFPVNAAGNAKLVTELTATDALIAPFVPSGRFMFRAPYGAFDARDYNVLHASAMDKYVGHIGWDIGSARTATAAADWACWQYNPQLTSKACGDLYANEIQTVGRGIVLMHDADYGNPSNHVATSGLGNTVDMVKYLVPILKARGYTFVRVDEVPAIASALPPLVVADAGADGSADASSPSDGGTSHVGQDAAPSTPAPPPASTAIDPPPAVPTATSLSASSDPCAAAASPPAAAPNAPVAPAPPPDAPARSADAH